jgi:hypothetical protein
MIRTNLSRFATSALGVLAGVTLLQAAIAGSAPSIMPAMPDNPTANLQMKQTLSVATSNAAFAQRGGGAHTPRTRTGNGDRHMGGGVRSAFVPWPFYPYYNYCAHHPTDQNC